MRCFVGIDIGAVSATAAVIVDGEVVMLSRVFIHRPGSEIDEGIGIAHVYFAQVPTVHIFSVLSIGLDDVTGSIAIAAVTWVAVKQYGYGEEVIQMGTEFLLHPGDQLGIGITQVVVTD